MSHQAPQAQRTVARISRPAAAAIHYSFFLTGCITALLGALLPAIREHHALDIQQAGALFVAQFLGSSLGSLLSQLRLRTSLVAGVALMAGGVALFPFMAWPAVLASVFVFGMGLGLVIPATNVVVAHAYPENRAATLSVLNLFWGAGAATCPIIGAALYARAGFNATFLVLAALAAVAWIALSAARFPTPQPASGAQRDGRGLRIAGLYCFLLFLYIGVETAVGGWTSTYVGALETNAGAAGWATWTVAAYWTALLAARGIAPVVLRNLSEERYFALTLLIALSGVAALLATSSPAAACAFAALIGVGLAPVYALLFASLSRAAEEQGVRLPGWLFAVSGLGGAVVPWLVGALADSTGSMRVGLAVVAGAISVLLATWWLAARAPRAETQPPYSG